MEIFLDKICLYPQIFTDFKPNFSISPEEIGRARRRFFYRLGHPFSGCSKWVILYEIYGKFFRNFDRAGSRDRKTTLPTKVAQAGNIFPA
jgi:hypothetical protein